MIKVMPTREICSNSIFKEQKYAIDRASVLRYYHKIIKELEKIQKDWGEL